MTSTQQRPVGPARGSIPGVSKAQRVMIEQHIARGLTDRQIVTEHPDLNLDIVAAVWDEMELVVSQPDEPTVLPCGTPGAYARHVDRGEPVDDECREAYRAHNRARMRTTRTEHSDELDEVAVLRIMAGTLRVPANQQSLERVEAIRRLAGIGLTHREIGERMGMARDAISKMCNRKGIAPAVPSRRPGVA